MSPRRRPGSSWGRSWPQESNPECDQYRDNTVEECVRRLKMMQPGRDHAQSEHDPVSTDQDPGQLRPCSGGNRATRVLGSDRLTDFGALPKQDHRPAHGKAEPDIEGENR